MTTFLNLLLVGSAHQPMSNDIEKYKRIKQIVLHSVTNQPSMLQVPAVKSVVVSVEVLSQNIHISKWYLNRDCQPKQYDVRSISS